MGIINLEVADWLVGVGYDTADTEAAIRAACARWATLDHRTLPAAFGVRTAAVGWRRRRVGIVHHGVAVRHRTPDLTSAVGALAAIFTDMVTAPAAHELTLPLRVFRRDDRAVLAEVAPAVDIDDRPFGKSGIAEVPTWRATVDPADGTVRCGGERAGVDGLVISPGTGLSFDDARRHLWSLAEGDRQGCAEWLDRFDESTIVFGDDPSAGIRRLLG